MADRVPPLKQETAEGDLLPTEFDHNEDGVDVRSVFYQNDTSDDTNVETSRDSSNNMTFKDGVVSGTKTLTDLLGGAAASLLGRAVFKVDGGLVYTTGGDVVIKENQ